MNRKRTLGNGDFDQGSTTLYVKNLNDNVNSLLLKHNLYLLFSTYGDIIDIVMKPGKMRGQAHIIFTKPTLANYALENLQKESFFDKSLDISFSFKKSKIIEEIDQALENSILTTRTE